MYNSCRNRHCPSCLSHRSAAWLDDRVAELLPVHYFHMVFTVPKEVAELALGNKQVVYDMLFKAAADTLREIGRDPQHLGGEIGFLSVLHTWSQKLIHHPHVHCVVPGGGLSRDRSRWISSKSKRFLLPVRVLAKVYRGKFLHLLRGARNRGELQFGGATGHLRDNRGFEIF